MGQRPSRINLLFILLLFCAPALRAQTLDERLKEIDEYAAKAGQDWKVPGFAMAIVKDDRAVFARGYGVRESVVYPYPRGWVTFTLDPQGRVGEMKIDVPNPDFDFKELEFKRRPDAGSPK